MEINLTQMKSNEDWLRFFAKIGECAKKLLSAKGKNSHITWHFITKTFISNAYPPIPDGSRLDYERWLTALSCYAKQHKIDFPSNFCRDSAANLALELTANTINPARRFRFYKRVWRFFGLDSAIWDVREAIQHPLGEHYRRLSTSEIRRLVRCAQSRNSDLADMILIGYWTGLRLSDIAELELCEIMRTHDALQIVPNKVRTRKPHPLTIPLVGDAYEIVRARAKGTSQYLFPESVRKHSSRRIAAIFKAARIRKIGNGRASFHSLRATFISLMDEAGVQPYITDAITGHASGTMHARYTQPALPVLRRAIAKALPRISVSDTVSDTLIPRRDKVNLAERGQTVC